MAKKIDVGGELNSTALDKKLVDAAQVKDGSRGEKTLVETNEEIEYLLAQEGERQKQFEANEAARQAEADRTEQDRADEAARTEAERQATFEANEAERQVLYEKVAKNTEGVEMLNANTGISEYPEFSEATAYAVGDVVLYEGLLKKYTSAHEPGVWDVSQVEEWSERKEVDRLEEKTRNIHREVIDIEDEKIIIEDNNGNVVAEISSDSSAFVNLKSNGKAVLTEHQPLDEYAKKTDIPNVSGLAAKEDLEQKQDIIPQISSEDTTSEDEEQVWESNDGNEVYAKIGNYGIKAKAFLNMDGTPLSGNTNYISNPSANFGKRRIGCVKYQPIIEDAINHIVEYGQSLSIGGSSIAISTTPEEGCYMLGSSVRDTTSTNFSPLKNNDGSDNVEAISTGEDMVVPTINALKYLCKQNRVDTEFLGTSSGNGGLIIDHLSKVSQAGKHYYQDNFLTHITNAKSAANNESKKIVCPAIMFIQGESDYSITKEYATGSYVVDYTAEGVRPAIDYYKNKLVQLKNDMQADIMNVYGQSLKPLFFVHAVGSGNQAARGAVVNMAQIEACAENDDMILVGAPTFAPHTDVHLTGNGYRWWAEFFARTIADSIFNNYKFEPVMPFDFKAIGNKIVIAHKVPCPPLVIDTHTVEPLTNFGFKLYSSSNNNTITGVEVDGCNVIITFAKEVVGTYELNYAASAGTGGNKRGNICDSDRCATLSQYIDDSENIYAPSGEINYRPKDKDGNFIFGKDYPMQNWCIPYSYIINF